jgi:hypothetical protein
MIAKREIIDAASTFRLLPGYLRTDLKMCDR